MRNKQNIQIAVVDDEISDIESIITQLNSVNERLTQKKYELQFESFLTCEKFFQDIETNPLHFHVVLLDLRFNNSPMQGEEVLLKMKKMKIHPEVIIITAHGTFDLCFELTEKGAYYYIDKYQIRENAKSLFLTIKNGYEKIQILKELQERSIKRAEFDKKYGLIDLIGENPIFLESLELAMKAAKWDVPILLLGETGTGKEEYSKVIHKKSSRVNNKFIPINCGSIPRELLESELFGHERGAFSGAIRTNIGVFEEADGGTIFLDEIGEMAPDLQVKLLRVLQSGEIRRVGSTEIIKTDVRIIASTNKNLAKEVEAGRFREDLFFRLNVIPIRIPNLSKRVDDIPRFVKEILKEKTPEGKKTIEITTDALRILKQYQWRGNIRELRSIILRCLILDNDKVIDEQDVKNAVSYSLLTGFEDFEEVNLSFEESVRNFKYNLLKKIAIKAHWDFKEISRISGLSIHQVKQHFRKKTHDIIV